MSNATRDNSLEAAPPATGTHAPACVDTEQAPPAPPAPAAPVEPAPVPAAPAQSTDVAPSKAPPQRKPLDQYKVLLHNDDHSEMMFVVQSIVQIAHVPTKTALGVMLEAHRSGVALVAVTHQELAELYRDQFASKGLTATIEKA